MPAASVVLAEEVGRSTHGGFAITVLVHTDMASPHLVRFGSKRQLEKYLPDVMAGKAITAVGVTEPGAGSDVAGIRTRAVRDGNDYVLNGAKMFITNGVHGDLYFVAAKTDPEAKGSRAISMFIVEKGTPGFRVGRALDKTGWRSSDTAELVFEDCRVPAENLLGEENRGFYSIMANFQTERLVIAAMAMAEAREALRLTFELRESAHGLRRAAVGEAGDPPAPVDAAGRGRGGAPARAHTAWLDAEGRDCVAQVSMVKALAGDLVNRGPLRLRAVPRRHGLHARDARSSACRATPASSRSAAAPRRSCSRRSPSGSARQLSTDLHAFSSSAKTDPMQSDAPRYWDDYEVGQKFPLGSTRFTEQEIVDFARQLRSAELPRRCRGGQAVDVRRAHRLGLARHLQADAAVRRQLRRPAHGAGLARPRRDPLAEAGAARRHADRLGRMRGQGAVQEPAGAWASSTSIGGATNQKGELVMTAKGINMVRRRPA